VGSDTGSSLDVIAILGEEMPHIGDLGEEESKPIERAHQRIQGKWSIMIPINPPDGVSPMLLIIVRLGECVVDGGNDSQEPSEDGQDLVSPDSLNIVGIASGEGVGLREVRHFESEAGDVYVWY